METAINPTTRERLQYNSKLGEWVPAEPKPRGSLLDPIMQGLTFGYADELGGAGAMLGRKLAGAPPERVQAAGQREMATQRARLADIRQRMPWSSFSAEMTGGLSSGIPAAKGLMSAFRGLGAFGSPIATGAVEGTVAGAGAANENRLVGGAVGGTLGATLPALLPMMGGAIRFGQEKLTPLARKVFESPPTTASRVMSDYLKAGGETPTLLTARQRQLGPQATLVDVAGAPGVGLGQGVIQADKTGQALMSARREMAKRAAGSTQRLTEDLRGITGVEQRLDPSLKAVRDRQVAAAAPAYARAYERTISLTPKLKSLLDRPPMQKAWNEAREAAATRGEELPPFFKLDEFGDWQKQGVMPDMRAWDRMKQGIDRMIERETDAITGRMTPRGRDLTMMKKELIQELDEINPDYAEARKIFAGDEAIQGAMRQGEKFLNMKTRQVKSAVKDMTDSEKEGFLTGAMESVREKMGRARSGEIGEFKFLELANTREKLRDLFPAGREGDKQLAELMRTLNRERTFATNQGLLVGNAQTALRQQAGEALESGVSVPTIAEVLVSPARGGTQAAIGGLSHSMAGLGQKPISELSSMIFDPQQTSRAIAEMQRRGIPPLDMMEIMQRYSRGGAMLAPVAGLGAGEAVNF